MIQTFFQGMLWIILLYNFFLFLSSREKVYLAYVLYIFGFSMFSSQNTGLLIDYILPEYPHTAYFFRVTGLCIIFIAYSWFILTFLPSHTINSFWRKFLKVLMIAQILITLVYIAAVYFLENIPLYSGLSIPISAIVMLFMIIFFIHLATKYWKNTLVKYFLIGSLFVIGGGFISNALRLVKLDFIKDVYTIVQAGGVLEILVFSLGLGYRVKKLEKENAKILENQNQMLEEKVKKRTQEISQKQEEILVQNEELHQQQEEIISQRDYIETQNSQLKQTNTQFTDSVRYAKTIQEAILPFGKRLTSNFEEHFVLFRPRDIVSGDFYWIYETSDSITKEKIILIAALDCTGHGVPGAFISLIGFALLNEIVAKEHIISPAKILKRLDERLQEALKQKQTNNMDGMDVALCSVKKMNANNEFEVVFSGAKRPLYYIENKELKELKGNKISVGGITKKKERTKVTFEEQKITLSKNDKIYLTTDGFADQNDKDKQKIGSLQLQEIIKENHNLSLSEQKTKLEETLDHHQGKEEQRDDITILGVKL
ncbi:7TM diverse intracellular signaling domain-containing protein [Bernardetia sp. ABR2-2B]|uniref:7TM diverse intracellular signaling domain-containing protein n=1 Tax=Bernardetia sp. ABR2-2B TaxID=3127472 RepID=UPI0030CFE831